MLDRLKAAVEKVERLSRDRQAYAALLLEEVAASNSFKVPEDHRPAILEGLQQAKSGNVVPDDEMIAFWKQLGL